MCVLCFSGRESVLQLHPPEDLTAGCSAQGQKSSTLTHLLSFLPCSPLTRSVCLQDDGLSITDMSSLQAPLDIPIPDPPSPEDEVRPAPSTAAPKIAFRYPHTWIKYFPGLDLAAVQTPECLCEIFRSDRDCNSKKRLQVHSVMMITFC